MYTRRPTGEISSPATITNVPPKNISRDHPVWFTACKLWSQKAFWHALTSAGFPQLCQTECVPVSRTIPAGPVTRSLQFGWVPELNWVRRKVPAGRPASRVCTTNWFHSCTNPGEIASPGIPYRRSPFWGIPAGGTHFWKNPFWAGEPPLGRI